MIILIIISIIVGLSIFYYQKNNKKEKKKEIVEIEENNELKVKEKDKNKEVEIEYKVDIKGAVNLPGIYSMKSTSRVIDVINEAGGLTDLADTSVINLSKKIIDEMVIIIYTKEQVANFTKVKETEKIIQDKCNQVDENSLKNDACIKTEEITSKVSINNSPKEVLMTLQGIGESKANDIIKYREENGPFNSIEDIKNVPGIGDNLFAQIKEDITL